MEEHASQIHQINKEGLQKLVSLVEGCHWLNRARAEQQLKTPSKENDDIKTEEQIRDGKKQDDESNNEDNSVSSIGAISEKHVYKYRCSQCSLAFKTQEKLETHSQYHLIRDTTKCKLCDRSFRTIQALLKHLESGHTESSQEELAQYKLSLMTNPLLLAGIAGQVLDSTANEMLPDEVEMDANKEKDSIKSASFEENERIMKDQMDNITKQGKKVDKILAYPMEKYLDPNRPFKCDVCKESFTQKNILLVHFNSVSHLHKLKKVMKEQQENPLLLTPQSDKGSPNPTTTQPGSTLLSVLGSLNAKKQLEPDDEVKLYKCNICKVSYSQSSTLDIHIRSVLHNTRASRLQELVMMGHVDLNRPLIEQPDDKENAGTDSKDISQLLSPQSITSNSSNSPTLQKTPTHNSTSPFSSPQPLSSTPNFSQSFSSQRSLNDIFGNQSEDSNSEQLASFLQSTFSSNQSELSTSTSSNSDMKSNPLLSVPEGKKSSHVLKSLLQNYGFELVMQFNESHQRRKLEERLRLEKEIQNAEANKKQEDVEMKDVEQPQKEEKIPEMRKSSCPICQKEFSSIWVLKAHTEEVHKVVVPQEFVQKYIEELKSNADQDETQKDQKKDDETKEEENKAKEVSNGIPKSDEKLDNEIELNKPKVITPDDQKTTKSRTGTPEDINQGNSNHSAQPDEMQDFMKKALKAMQQQNLNSLNPNNVNNNLQNMNLHPPLIPPGIVPPGTDPFTAALFLQASQKSQQNSMTAFENQILTKLGIDPEIVKQAGLDPKFLIHLANMDPKSALDPKVLAMMTQKPEMPGVSLQNQKMMQLAMDKQMGFFPGLPQPMMPHHDPNIFNRGQQQFVDQNKRARTRITDDQLKILRSNFDINNSPSEEQTNTMAQQTGLPPKVIKHWFRNTLFKERQRNKDSPYNFNNPPSTMINLEEYEKTGESKVIHLKPEEQKEYKNETNKSKEVIKVEEDAKDGESIDRQQEPKTESSEIDNQNADAEAAKYEEIRRLQMSLGLNVSVANENFNALTSPFDTMFSSQMGPLEKHSLLHSPLAGNFPNPLSFMSGPGHFPPNILNGFGALRDPSPHSDHPGLSHSPNSKRANRTRFTDYQIKVLQEFFENNAYPKDDDLEYLSKLLGLSPRVIVVWFQNARQKARKIYENQPSLDPDDEGAGRFTRTPGLNYQCKKCLLVFQRYYELIRHQKQHCFKEEDAKRSAQAQKAAAHAAATFVGQSNMNMNSISSRPDNDCNSSLNEQNIVSPMSLSDIRRSCDSDENKANHSVMPIQFQRLMEEKKAFGTMFEKYSQEERVIKFINETSQNPHTGYPLSTPFALLQKQASENIKFEQDSDDQSMDSFISSPASKRKLSDDNDDIIERDENGQPKDKRLRTTILPEQLDYLYQKYQIESNPSRKMLEQIAAEVGLRKRVVQVWFQNTRARERKGQFRAHQQVINKRCPFCPALFKVRSALESHLATKHASQYTRGEINIDSLPDAGSEEVQLSGRSTLFPSIPCPSSPPPGQMPPLIPNNEKSSEFEASMRKYYEDTMKQFISDVKIGRQPAEKNFKNERSNEALDLSSPPLKHNNTNDEIQQDGTKHKFSKQEHSPSPGEEHDNQIFDLEDDQAMDLGGYTMEMENDQFNQHNLDIKKRYRTQMTNMQVKLMKHVFELHKTPSMNECLNLAQLIGLQKRVVQVWFQNARAKEKKARLNLQQITGKEPEMSEPPKECKFCSRRYENKFGIQEHIFDSNHLDNVRKAIEDGNYEPETPGYVLSQTASALYKSEDMEESSKTGSGPARSQNNHVTSISPEDSTKKEFTDHDASYGKKDNCQYNPEQPTQQYRTDQQNFDFHSGQEKFYPPHPPAYRHPDPQQPYPGEQYANYNSNFSYSQNHGSDFNHHRYPNTSHGEAVYNAGYGNTSASYNMSGYPCLPPGVQQQQQHYPPHQLYPAGELHFDFFNYRIHTKYQSQNCPY